MWFTVDVDANVTDTPAITFSNLVDQIDNVRFDIGLVGTVDQVKSIGLIT